MHALADSSDHDSSAAKQLFQLKGNAGITQLASTVSDSPCRGKRIPPIVIGLHSCVKIAPDRLGMISRNISGFAQQAASQCQRCITVKHRFSDHSLSVPTEAVAFRPKSQLWRPDSERSLLIPSKADSSSQVWCGQGPPPPNPMVVERFSQVISQLFQQVLPLVVCKNICQYSSITFPVLLGSFSKCAFSMLLTYDAM